MSANMQRDVVEAVGDERLAVAQPLGDRLGQDVQQQPLVLAREALPLLDGRHIGAVDVDEAELGHVHRQQGVGPASSPRPRPSTPIGRPHPLEERLAKVRAAIATPTARPRPPTRPALAGLA